MVRCRNFCTQGRMDFSSGSFSAWQQAVVVLEVGWADSVRVFSKAEIYCGLLAALQARVKPVMTVVLFCGRNVGVLMVGSVGLSQYLLSSSRASFILGFVLCPVHQVFVLLGFYLCLRSLLSQLG